MTNVEQAVNRIITKTDLLHAKSLDAECECLLKEVEVRVAILLRLLDDARTRQQQLKEAIHGDH